MASIVYQIDKKTGAKYAFESVSYWDKDKKQPRSKRRYLGRTIEDHILYMTHICDRVTSVIENAV